MISFPSASAFAINAGNPGAGRIIEPTTTVPSADPSMIPAASAEAASGPGTSARPSSSKTTTDSTIPRPSPPCSSGDLIEKTPARPSSSQSAASTVPAPPSSARRRSRAKRPAQTALIPSARAT